MVKKLSEIDRTSTFAWSPGQQTPIIAAGTAAGSIDESFSNASELELFKLDVTSSSNGLVSAGKIPCSARFTKLVWGNASSSNPYGFIAGALENSNLVVWDANKILNGEAEEKSKILESSHHTGKIEGLAFNRFKTNLFASAGSDSKVRIWDFDSLSEPKITLPSINNEGISSVAWNGQVDHILASSSPSGNTIIWDTRSNKKLMELKNPKTGNSISSVAWHPDVATQLVTASDDKQNPVVALWDLRHTQYPEKILAGHSEGVLDVSWCHQDSSLLLSCGKDRKTLIWDPTSGELLGEVAQDNNWTFQTEWCPRYPDLFASASLNNIKVYSLQNTESEEVISSAVDTANDDPFTAALNQSAAATTSAFALKRPPKWLRCPAGASFGFGGKLITFSNKSGVAAEEAAAKLPPGQAPSLQQVPRTVSVTSVITDKEIVQRSTELETALEQQSVDQLVTERIQQSKPDDKDEKESWEIIKTLLAEDAREQLMNYLGFQKSEVAAAVAKATAGKNGLNSTTEEEAAPTEPTIEATKEDKAKEPTVTDDNTEAVASTDDTTTEEVIATEKPNQTTDDDVSSFFQNDTAGDDFFGENDGGISAAVAASAALTSQIKHEPLQLYAEGSSETDRLITRAVALGDFESAVDLCLSTDRLSDALLFAIYGGSDLLARTQQIYFKRQSKTTSYLRLLESIADEDLNSIVANVELKEWASVIVVLCTFAKTEEFKPLCETLGARLEEGQSENTKEYRRHAMLCYLAAGNLEKVSRIWIAEQEEEASKEEDNTATTLQNLIEKITIFCKIIAFEDPALSETSSKMFYEYPLAPLYDKYCEYAELLAEQGKLTTALFYLSLTPHVYRKATFDKLSIVRDRVYRACPARVASQYAEPIAPFETKSVHSQVAEAEAATSYNNQASSYQYQQPDYARTSYAPVNNNTSSNFYAPDSNVTQAAATGAPTNMYQPQKSPVSAPSVSAPSYGYNQYTNYNQPAANSYGNNNNFTPGNNQYINNNQPAVNSYGNNQVNNTSYAGPAFVPAPPPMSGMTSSPRLDAPKKPEGAWNDPPMVKSKTIDQKRASAPGSSPQKRVMSPFPNQPSPDSYTARPNNPHHHHQQQQQQQQLPPPPRNNIPPPPRAGMNQNMPSRPPQGMPPQGMPPQVMPPQGMPPQGMASRPPPGIQSRPPPMGTSPYQMGAPPPPPQKLPPPPMNPLPSGYRR